MTRKRRCGSFRSGVFAFVRPFCICTTVPQGARFLPHPCRTSSRAEQNFFSQAAVSAAPKPPLCKGGWRAQRAGGIALPHPVTRRAEFLPPTLRLLPHQSPPCVKGGGAACRAGGIALPHRDNRKCPENPAFVNPSVRFAASSLYTREPTRLPTFLQNSLRRTHGQGSQRAVRPFRVNAFAAPTHDPADALSGLSA